LVRGLSLSEALVREFIRPAVRAVPSSLVRRLGSCRISLPAEVAAGVASRWTITNGGLEVSLMTAGIEEHDVAMVAAVPRPGHSINVSIQSSCQAKTGPRAALWAQVLMPMSTAQAG